MEIRFILRKVKGLLENSLQLATSKLRNFFTQKSGIFISPLYFASMFLHD